MSVSSLLLPLFVQVFLTFAVMSGMWVHRRRALLLGEVRMADIALRQQAWPAQATKFANSFHNQLELPVLFYVLVALILITKTNSIIFVILAWLFVLARLVHAWVHTGSNYVPHRARAMSASVAVLFLMWVIFAVRILLSGA
jgi:hypothetical protein